MNKCCICSRNVLSDELFGSDGIDNWHNTCASLQYKDLVKRNKFLEESLDLCLTDISADITTSRQEIEWQYGNDYLKNNSESNQCLKV